jgi:hypothetical protein
VIKWQEKHGGTTPPSPFTPGVLDAEKWALFSHYPYYHKITGHLTHGIYSTMGFPSLAEYIS